MTRLHGLFVMDESALPMVYGPEETLGILRHVDLVGPAQTRQSVQADPSVLRDVEVMFTGWGCPPVDEAFLEAAPKLKAIFYGAGSVSSWITDAVWDRGIVVSSAYAANAVPVAEYALATILFSLKHGWSLALRTCKERTFPQRDGAPGCYHSTVGLLSLGVTARTLVRLLRPFDLRVIAHDPFVTQDEAAEMGVELVSLDELFRRSDAVSVHTPLLTETRGLVTGAHLASMKHGSTFINTARGEIVREPELIAVLQRRPDLQAVLDVAAKEPPEPDSALYSLPNVVLTPHIAGSVGRECRRLGRYMLEELRRFVDGKPLQWQVTRDLTLRTSHRPSRAPRPRVTVAVRRPDASVPESV